MKIKVSAIVLTFNEEKNLEACLSSINDYTDEIIIIDSFSTDATLEIAKRYSNKIYQNKFVNQSKQFNWALKNAEIKNEWILRIDADERWTLEGFEELNRIFKTDDADGVYVKMKIYFMKRWIKHGGFYPNFFLRVFKKSKGSIEERWMDEHIFVTGKTIISGIDVLEMNYDRQENISLWTEKHNRYSTREAVEFLIFKYQRGKIKTIADLSGGKTEKKRWMKENFYYKLPLFVRPILYYIYRYIFLLGFLDGKEGLIYHLLQGFWYRFLVDVKIYQIKFLAKKNNKSIAEIIKEHYGINV
jgi:glycosyltransferase involved in cell wall biosynthesis